ncbi:MAG: hypothetical protein AB7U29_04685 [Desulfobulbus sp.]
MNIATEQHDKVITDERRLWLLVLATRDHAGDTAAIASVFSGRGIQIDSFIGFGSIKGKKDKQEGRIMITFHAFSERCQNLCRILESLEAVISVRCFGPETTVNDLLTQSRHIKNLLAAV